MENMIENNTAETVQVQNAINQEDGVIENDFESNDGEKMTPAAEETREACNDEKVNAGMKEENKNLADAPLEEKEDEGEELKTKGTEQAQNDIGDQDSSKIGGPDTEDTEYRLPPEVSEAPRNENEMHIGLIKHNPKLVEIYLQVSDDKGDLFPDKESVEVRKQFRERCMNLETRSKEELEELLAEGKLLGSRLVRSVNLVENKIAGIFTYRRIEDGEFFVDLKKVVRAVFGPKKWEKWCKAEFGESAFRSIQDYKSLAEIPGIKKYSVFGKERLLRTKRQLTEDDMETPDPVGTFIAKNGIDFDPENQTDDKELNFEMDVATNYQKCVNAGLEIPREKIKDLLNLGMEIGKKHIDELKYRKNLGRDIVADLAEIMASDGNIPKIMTPERKAEGFKKSTEKFIKEIESAIDDEEYLGRFKAEKISILRAKLQELEQKLQDLAEKAENSPSNDEEELSSGQGGN